MDFFSLALSGLDLSVGKVQTQLGIRLSVNGEISSYYATGSVTGVVGDLCCHD